MSVIYSDVLYDISGSWSGPPYTQVPNGDGSSNEIDTFYGTIETKIYAGYKPGDTSFGLYTDLGIVSTMSALPSSFIDNILNYKDLHGSLYNNVNSSGYVDISGSEYRNSGYGHGSNYMSYYIGTGGTDTNLYNVKINYLIGRGGDFGSSNNGNAGGDGGYGLSIYGNPSTSMNISTFYGFQEFIINPGTNAYTNNNNDLVPETDTSIVFIDKGISTLFLNIPKAAKGNDATNGAAGTNGADMTINSVTGYLKPNLAALNLTYGNITTVAGGSSGPNLYGDNHILYGNKSYQNLDYNAGQGLARLIITKTGSSLSNSTLSETVNTFINKPNNFPLFKNIKLAGPISGVFSVFGFLNTADISGNNIISLYTDIQSYITASTSNLPIPPNVLYVGTIKLYGLFNKFIKNTDGNYGFTKSLGNLYEFSFLELIIAYAAGGDVQILFKPSLLQIPTHNYISILPFDYFITGAITYPDGSITPGGNSFRYDKNHDAPDPSITEVNCLLKGTKVKILGGYKLIEDIKVGDFILSHKGNLAQVLKTVSWDIKWSETATNESNTVYKIPAGEVGCDEDTYISAYHQILIDGKLVAAKDAGLELARESEVGSEFTFYHLHVVNYQENHLVVNGNCIVESWSGLTPKPVFKSIEPTKVNIRNFAKKVLDNTRDYLSHLTPKFMKKIHKVSPI